jgi:hypothetical protein
LDRQYKETEETTRKFIGKSKTNMDIYDDEDGAALDIANKPWMNADGTIKDRKMFLYMANWGKVV